MRGEHNGLIEGDMNRKETQKDRMEVEMEARSRVESQLDCERVPSVVLFIIPFGERLSHSL